MIMLDFRAAEQIGSVKVALDQFARIFGSHDRKDARRGVGARQIDRPDRALGDCGPDNDAIGLIGDSIVPFIGVSSNASCLELAINAVMRLADHL